MSVYPFTFFKKPQDKPMLSNEQIKNLKDAFEELKKNFNQLENTIRTETPSPSALKH